MKNDKNKSPKQPSKNGLSRRGFLRGAGLTTAGSVVFNSAVLAFETEASPAVGKAFGPDSVTIEMNVNGQMRSLIVEPRTTLASALRDHVGLTGTKLVCDRGSCSACTVWLDGKPINSCMTLAMDVGSRQVDTIEGLAKDGELHPLQEAFIEHDASQCGYCTPGMLMTAAHLLKSNPDPTLQEVKKAMRGNLCRCGTYPHVFKATLAAAKKMK